jgi:hypothetical protein
VGRGVFLLVTDLLITDYYLRYAQGFFY